MNEYTFSCSYKAGETHRLPQFHFPHTILSIRESRRSDGWVHVEVHFESAVSADIFRGMTAVDVFRESLTHPVSLVRGACLSAGEPMNGQRAKPGTVPYKRPHQLMRSRNLRREY